MAKVTERGVSCLAAIAPLGVVAWVEELGREPSTLTIKQRFVAIRHVFDWLWLAHIPSASVREPAHVVRRGGTPVIEATEAKAPLDHIDVSSYAGVRDRALTGLMVYSLAPSGAALAMKVEGAFVQNHRL